MVCYSREEAQADAYGETRITKRIILGERNQHLIENRQILSQRVEANEFQRSVKNDGTYVKSYCQKSAIKTAGGFP